MGAKNDGQRNQLLEEVRSRELRCLFRIHQKVISDTPCKRGCGSERT